MSRFHHPVAKRQRGFKFRRTKKTRLTLQTLEDRMALTASISLGGGYGIFSYAGVGFQENEVATFSATLNGLPDPNSSDFSAQIQWGDGESAGSLVNLGQGNYEVKGSHVYSQINSSIPITVTVTGPQGSKQTVPTASADVAAMPSGIAGKQPPTIGSSAPPENVVLSLGGGYGISSYAGVGFEENEVATFSALVDGVPDSTLSDFHAQINFGDSASWTTGDLVNLGNGNFEVKGTHVYTTADSNIPIVVYITGPDGTSDSADTASAVVNKMPSGIAGTKPASATNAAAPEDVVLSLGGGYGINATAGVTVQSKEVATFSALVSGQPDDKPSDFHAQINFGDHASWSMGTVSNTGSGNFMVTGSHVYQDAKSNIPIVVYVTGPDGTSASGQTASANVAPNPNTITALPVPVFGTEGASFSGTVATFTDSDTKATQDDFTATVIWQDGSTTKGETIGLGAGFAVTVDKDFDEEGTQSFAIEISGKDGASATVPDVATIKDAALTAQSASITATEGKSFSGFVASFSDADPKGTASDYTATITWGDGAVTTGSISAGSKDFTVSGTHTFAEEGTHSVTVSMRQQSDGDRYGCRGGCFIDRAGHNSHRDRRRRFQRKSGHLPGCGPEWDCERL